MLRLFYCPELDDPDNKNNYNTATGMLFAEASIFNNEHLDIVAPSPKNNNPNMSASFLIIAKFLFMFCS